MKRVLMVVIAFLVVLFETNINYSVYKFKDNAITKRLAKWQELRRHATSTLYLTLVGVLICWHSRMK